MQLHGIDAKLQITVSGVVQGVGFRPFVYNLALRHCLRGYVCNEDGTVEIEVQGEQQAVSSFLHDLEFKAPPAALIRSISTRSELPEETRADFQILPSKHKVTNQKFVPPDLATCVQCLRELFDPVDRRFHYPFVNCTNCGPRFTIINSLPYDRCATTMASFAMCAACQREYEDPADRRFHAQPNACPVCGPRLSFIDSTGNRNNVVDAIQSALGALRNSQIVAVKGLGGFHLVCDALDKEAIQKLRQRKRRQSKPLAVMMTDLDMIEGYCRFSAQEADELNSPRHPVVLLKKLADCDLPHELAPGLDRIGVMLPYAPLHHLLMAAHKRPIVATSGNWREEPIAIDNEEALVRLKDLADSFLMHDREIYSRYDDSVVQFVRSERTILRRARGFAPLPLQLPFKSNLNVLAFGGHLKNTFCLIRDDQAFISQHIGDLENLETQDHFNQVLKTYLDLFDIAPGLVSHDCHPDYLSTSMARDFSKKHSLPKRAAQHHHAHVVSCMVEHGITQPVIGVAFDGLGYGLDGTLWGGEFFLTTLSEYERLAHFQALPIPGGNLAIKQPWRAALGYIEATSSVDSSLYGPFIAELKERQGEPTLTLVSKQLRQKLNSPRTSSCGRLFDVISALLGVCWQVDFEGQAAMELETIAEVATGCDGVYPYAIVCDRLPWVIKLGAIIEGAYRDLLMQVPVSLIALKFHHTIAQIVVDVCSKIGQSTMNTTVCLSGGVFQNRLLLDRTCDLLAERGFKVFFPNELPANDGGLSLGQAVIALANANGIVFNLGE